MRLTRKRSLGLSELKDTSGLVHDVIVLMSQFVVRVYPIVDEVWR